MAKLVDKLVAENSALKQDKMKIELANKRLSKQVSRLKLSTKFTDRELSLVANQIIPETELTTKIFKRNLSQLNKSMSNLDQRTAYNTRLNQTIL